MKSGSRWMQVGQTLATGAFFMAFALSTHGQVQTETKTVAGQPTHEVKVERGEVVTVEGNDLIVKSEDGQILHFPNVPDSVRVSVGGQQLGVHDLKPGMKLERTITTTTTPKTITTTQNVTGTVWQVTPPRSVILRLENGTNERFTIPSGQRFNINGNDVDAFGLRRGMRITATRVVEEPMIVSSQHRQVTGTMPPTPPQPPAANVPILIAVLVPAQPAAAAPAEEAPAKLPKTGSIVPLVGLLGLLFTGMSLGLTMLRKLRHA